MFYQRALDNDLLTLGDCLKNLSNPSIGSNIRSPLQGLGDKNSLKPLAEYVSADDLVERNQVERTFNLKSHLAKAAEVQLNFWVKV